MSHPQPGMHEQEHYVHSKGGEVQLGCRLIVPDSGIQHSLPSTKLCMGGGMLVMTQEYRQTKHFLILILNKAITLNFI